MHYLPTPIHMVSYGEIKKMIMIIVCVINVYMYVCMYVCMYVYIYIYTRPPLNGYETFAQSHFDCLQVSLLIIVS